MSRPQQPSNPPSNPPGPLGAAAMLRRLLDAVEEGDLDAPGSHGARLLRRMEGAAAALELKPSGPKSVKEGGKSEK